MRARKSARRSAVVDARSQTDAQSTGKQPGKNDPQNAIRPDVLDATGTGTVASTRGKIAVVRHDGGLGERRVANPKTEDHPEGAVPGDRVEIEFTGDSGRIASIQQRRTKLVRMRPESGRRVLAREHIIAANIDIVVIVGSTVSPPFRPRLIDRYLVMCQYGGVEPVICINKVDLQEPDEAALSIYTDLGVTWIPVSAETGEGMEALRDTLDGRLAVLAGHSGVGKSSLINALTGEADLRVGTIGSEQRGQHTTSSSTMVEWAPDSLLIDTPGIRSFGLWDIDASTLAAYFPEFTAYVDNCYYRDCTHENEPDCAVRAATEEGHIARARFESYLRMLSEDA